MGNPVQGVLDKLTGGQQQQPQPPQAGQAGQQQQPPAGPPPAGAGNQQQQGQATSYTYRCIENCTYSGRFYRTGETIDLLDQQDVPHFERADKE